MLCAGLTNPEGPAEQFAGGSFFRSSNSWQEDTGAQVICLLSHRLDFAERREVTEISSARTRWIRFMAMVPFGINRW